MKSSVRYQSASHSSRLRHEIVALLGGLEAAALSDHSVAFGVTPNSMAVPPKTKGVEPSLGHLLE